MANYPISIRRPDSRTARWILKPRHQHVLTWLLGSALGVLVVHGLALIIGASTDALLWVGGCAAAVVFGISAYVNGRDVSYAIVGWPGIFDEDN